MRLQEGSRHSTRRRHAGYRGRLDCLADEAKRLIYKEDSRAGARRQRPAASRVQGAFSRARL